MTAPLGNTANRFSGIRELGQVTNSYGGYVVSAGAAYNLSLPYFPDKFEWYNATKYATGGTGGAANIQGVWFRDMALPGGLTFNRATAVLSAVVEGANGIADSTIPGGFYDEHLVAATISAGTPGVVTTSTNHNLSDNDRVIITKAQGTMAASINNRTYLVKVVNATSFQLYRIRGTPFQTVGTYTASSAQITKIAPALGNPAQPVTSAFPHKAIVDYPPVVQLTLGTDIMGLTGDVIYFTAWQFNSYVNRGTAS